VSGSSAHKTISYEKLIIIIAALFSTKTFATNYYFSNAGNDNNAGTNPASSFKTIDKLNTLPLTAGDSVLFRCGDVSGGKLILSQVAIAATISCLQVMVVVANLLSVELT